MVLDIFNGYWIVVTGQYCINVTFLECPDCVGPCRRRSCPLVTDAELFRMKGLQFPLKCRVREDMEQWQQNINTRGIEGLNGCKLQQSCNFSVDLKFFKIKFCQKNVNTL